MNSTDKKDTKKKKVKKKGPIRLEAIIPITVVIILFGVYFKYFFDSHLRQGIQYGATQAHGAEVNVGGLQSNFLAPSISIYKVQVTDKSDPRLNIIEIGEIRLKLLWDGLLRGKFVIPESSILKVQTKSQRRRPGRILPPKPKKKGAKGTVAKAAEQTLDQLKKKNDSNLLSDIFSVVGGTNYKDQLKKMEGQLKTKEKIATLEKELKNKEEEWKKKIDELPDESEIKKLTKKIESIKINTKNPKAIQESFKKIDAVYKEARSKYKTVDAAKKAFKADIKKYDNEYKGLEKLVEKDIQGMTDKLNIPSLDPQEINKMLLGNLVASQLGSLMKYKDVAREYLPTKSAEERKSEKAARELTPVERAEGVNYRFPKKKSYPRFWLKKATISSDSKKGQAGDLTGTLKNVTNNPRHLGIPTTFDFKGGFPHQKIFDVIGKITIDHTTDKAVEKGSFSVGRFPVEKNHLNKSKDVELGYNKADGSSKVNFIMQNQQLNIASKTLFQNVDYFVKASDKKVLRLLTNVTKDLRSLDLKVRAKGSWDDLSLHINSNLGQKLQRAIKAQVSGEIKKARKDVENHIKGLVSKEKGKLKGELAKLEKKLGLSLKSREAAVQSVKQSVDNKKKNATKKEKKKVEDKLKNKAKKLFKGLKF